MSACLTKSSCHMPNKLLIYLLSHPFVLPSSSVCSLVLIWIDKWRSPTTRGVSGRVSVPASATKNRSLPHQLSYLVHYCISHCNYSYPAHYLHSILPTYCCQVFMVIIYQLNGTSSLPAAFPIGIARDRHYKVALEMVNYKRRDNYKSLRMAWRDADMSLKLIYFTFTSSSTILSHASLWEATERIILATAAVLVVAVVAKQEEESDKYHLRFLSHPNSPFPISSAVALLPFNAMNVPRYKFHDDQRYS